MKISLNDFKSLSKGTEAASLLQALQGIVGTMGPHDEKFRRMVRSDVLDDAHVVLASTEGCVRISAAAGRSADEPLWLDIGCVSKLITSTAIQTVFKGQGGALKQRLVDLIDVGNAAHLSEVTLEHLLNHTHGIDEPQGISVQRTREGKVDVPATLNLAGPELLSPPGQLYSYSCAGPWLIAAVLENMFRERFIDIVRQVLPTILPPRLGEETLCPALGGTVRVNAENLLSAFVSATAFSTPLATRQVRLGPALTVPYPGWHPQERAICAGWKAYNHGWFGHQSILTETPMMVRVEPSDGLGFLISSRSVHPWRILSSLFAEELVGRPTPYLSPPRGGSPASRPGTYRRVDSQAVVVSGPSSNLRLDTTFSPSPHSDMKPASWSGQLQAAGPDLFRISSPMREGEMNHGFFQFVRDQRGEVTHLWNGGMLWRKVA